MMTLTSKPEVKSISPEVLPVMEHYYTIQGEGVNAGHAAYFIRLGGCDVGCLWCDVKESWEADHHPLMKVSEIIDIAMKHPSRMAVVTGGEPLMYNLDGFCNALHQNGFKTCLETSGAYPLSGKWDWVCVSPKKFKLPVDDMLSIADELKVVVYNKSDFSWAEMQSMKTKPGCRLLLQPEYSRFKDMIPLIVEYVKLNPQWQISLQTHKIINVP